MGLVLPILSILVFFFSFWIFNLSFYNSDDLIGIFNYTMSSPKVYLGLALLIMGLYLAEKLITLVSGEFAQTSVELSIVDQEKMTDLYKQLSVNNSDSDQEKNKQVPPP